MKNRIYSDIGKPIEFVGYTGATNEFEHRYTQIQMIKGWWETENGLEPIALMQDLYELLQRAGFLTWFRPLGAYSPEVKDEDGGFDWKEWTKTVEVDDEGVWIVYWDNQRAKWWEFDTEPSDEQFTTWRFDPEDIPPPYMG